MDYRIRMDCAAAVSSILMADPVRRRLLKLVSELDLPDCWIGAGFVRNAVWDFLHQRAASPLAGDVDVIWFNDADIEPDRDRRIEEFLLSKNPTIQWSVKNQARMHGRNGDDPYKSASDAMRYWPETATAVAARYEASNACKVSAPLGFDDLFDLVLRPTARFADEKFRIFEDRLRSKEWLAQWPLLRTAV